MKSEKKIVMITKRAEEDMLNSEQFEKKTISRKRIYSGKVINIAVDEVCLPDGGTSKRELVFHPSGVGIVVFDEQDCLPLVKQSRKPLEKVILEIPAGKIDPGEGQNPEMTAAGELEEETGYRSRLLSHLISMYLSPGFANEVLYTYHAQGIEKVENPLVQDEDEVLELYRLTLEEVQQVMKGQLICDAKTIYVIQYWELLTKGEWRDRLMAKEPLAT